MKPIVFTRPLSQKEKKSSTVMSLIWWAAAMLFMLALGACSGGGDDNPGQVPIIPGGQDYNEFIVHDSFQGQNYVVVGIEERGYMAAFKPMLTDGTTVELEQSLGNWPNVLVDSEGSAYNFMGVAVSGPNMGKRLESINSQLGYWFSINTTFPTALYPESEVNRPIPTFDSEQWNIDPATVVSGALKDAIQALDQPAFINANDEAIIENNDFLAPDDRVLIIANEEITRVYPYKILDRHEIVNDRLGNDEIVISYCPLTGTGSVWRAVVGQANLDFGVSGLLSESNLILYDRTSESYWSQIHKEAVFGPMRNTKPELYPYQETKWSAVKDLPNLERVEVLSEDTGFDFDYNIYPYGPYRTDHDLIFFPTSFSDNRVPAKEIVLGVIIDGKAKAYRFSTNQ